MVKISVLARTGFKKMLNFVKNLIIYEISY